MSTTTTTPKALDLVLETRPTEQAIDLVDVAADIGNARAEILVQPGGLQGSQAAKLISMPAIRSLEVVFSADLFERMGMSANAWSQLGADEHIIDSGSGERFVGWLAVDHARAQSGGRGSDRR